jgi:fatty-acyl-CoA synthase
MLSHAAVDASARRVAMAFNDLGGQRVLVVMPLHHVAATVQLAFLAQGCPLRILSRFEPEVVLRRLAEDACALTLLVPAMIEALLHAPNAAGARLPALRYLFYGASPIPERALREAMRAWPVGFVQGYGLTETCGLLTLLTPEDHRLALDGRTELLQSCGRPLAGTSVQVVGPDGAELAAGEAGEIVASGPQLMSGYFGQPDATREALRDGRLHTGDAGAFDADGYLFIRDRLKDMIVSGGENVYPREVEEALTQVPGIAEAAVIGVPHDRWGEAVKAVVRLQPGVTLSEEEIVQACRSRLGGYKLPKSVTFVDELPRNATGKVLKKVLREPYWRGHARAVN